MAGYRDVADDLRRRIKAGDLPTGSKVRQDDLAAHYSTHRSVIADAVRVLEGEGLVRAVRRSGTIVQYPVTRRRIDRGTKVTRESRTVGGIPVPIGGYSFPAAHGENWQTHGTPNVSTEPAPPRVADLLNLTEGTSVTRRRRITSPEGEEPFQIADSWIHPDAVAAAPRCAEPDTGPGGYLDRLEEVTGYGPLAWEEFTRARMPVREEAQLLQISEHAPVLEVARVSTAADGRVVEVTVCVIPADRVELHSSLSRAASAKWPRE